MPTGSELTPGTTERSAIIRSLPGLRRQGATGHEAERREGDALAMLATVATHPSWTEAAEAALVLRGGPYPAVGLLGRFGEATVARFAAIAASLDRHLSRGRHLDYTDVERGVDALAERIAGHLGDDLEHARFVAIPRGGHIVLGLLALALDLAHDAIARPGTEDGGSPRGGAAGPAPLVIVDDAALTGHRFSAFLSSVHAERVVFAHLCSPAPLREAIERMEPRVERCLHAVDLGVDAGEHAGEQAALWRERTGAQRYWLGDVDPVSFAWKEPDLPLWNAVTGTVETSWHLVGADRCYANRRLGPPRIRVERQPAPVGPLRPARDVLAGWVTDDTLVVADTATGTSHALSSTAGRMWDALLTSGTVEEAARAVAEPYEVPLATVRDDVAGLADQLVQAGLLTDQA